MSTSLYSPRLMVVDDEEDVCTVAKWALQQHGFEVNAFTSPIIALQQFRPHKYDLVLIDIKMPDMDGFEFYRRIEDIQHDVKVCFMTADTSLDDEIFIEFQADDKKKKRVCIARKPISVQELIVLLQTAADISEDNPLTNKKDRIWQVDAL